MATTARDRAKKERRVALLNLAKPGMTYAAVAEAAGWKEATLRQHRKDSPEFAKRLDHKLGKDQAPPPPAPPTPGCRTCSLTSPSRRCLLCVRREAAGIAAPAPPAPPLPPVDGCKWCVRTSPPRACKGCQAGNPPVLLLPVRPGLYDAAPTAALARRPAAHGSLAGYRRHERTDRDYCKPCKEAYAESRRGVKSAGSRGGGRLTRDRVLPIPERKEGGWGVTELARYFNVTTGAIKQHRKRYPTSPITLLLTTIEDSDV